MGQRSYPDRPLLGVSCAIWHNDKVLLVQRGQPPKQGFWALPGGLVEIGERCIEAICREVQEETGLIIVDPHFAEMKEIIEPDPGGAVRHHFVLAVYTVIADTDEVIAADDAKAAAWVPLQGINQYNVLPGIEDTVKKCRQTLEGLR